MPKKLLVFLVSVLALVLSTYALRLPSVSAQSGVGCCSGPTVCLTLNNAGDCVSDPNCSWTCTFTCTWEVTGACVDNITTGCQHGTYSNCSSITAPLTCDQSGAGTSLHNCLTPVAAPTSPPGTTPGVTPRPTSGQFYNGTWYAPTLDEFRSRVYGAPDSEIFGERYTFAQVNWIIHSLNLMAPQVENVGKDQRIDNQISLLLKQGNIADAFRIGGPIMGIAFSSADLLGNPPASGIQEIAQTLNKFNLAAPAHAQGYGYSNTSAIRPVWIASRNTAYLFVIILLVVAGFMVMFRVKLGPQTIVSAQLIIPRLIFALLGITFSYAVAGLVIDMVYLIVAFVISAVSVSASGIVTDLPRAIQYFATPGFSKIFFFIMFWWLGYSVAQLSVLNVLTGIFALILLIGVIFVLLKIWWMLFKSYAALLLHTIIGPWEIMLGVIPTSGWGFGKWLKNIISAALPFAVAPLMIFFAIAIVGMPESFVPFREAVNWFTGRFVTGTTTTGTTGTYPEFPMFGQLPTLDFKMLLVFVILSIIPKVADAIKESMKTGSKIFETGISEAMGAPKQAYDRFGKMQREADDRDIRNKQLADAGRAEPRFMSQGIGGEYDRWKRHHPSGGGSPQAQQTGNENI